MESTNEPLAAHTTFRTGGPADFYVRPCKDEFLYAAACVICGAAVLEQPIFVLGGGSNVLVADEGFRGVVLDTTEWNGITLLSPEENGGASLAVCSGAKSDSVAEFAASHSLRGAEFLAGLPGTIGGAVWMNARCYGRSVSDILGEVKILDNHGRRRTLPFERAAYGYKRSPHQTRHALILEVHLHLERGEEALIRGAMEEYRRDRAAKGHFSYPSAGSVFKNNRAFGKPAGKIIEELGLRGVERGGARIADWHGNFIINTGGASSADILALIRLVQKTAAERLGIALEPEIIFLPPLEARSCP
jgi:UDP-N-acetylmuramate dehydrogenase